MKKQLTIKTGSLAQMIQTLEKLETLNVDLDAEGRGKTITLTLYGDKADIKRALHKLRQIRESSKDL